jgi:carboxymethylenebutenolidase
MDRVHVMQLVRAFQVGELTRRQFVSRATLALGSVSAVNMLLAACASPTRSSVPPPVVIDPDAADSGDTEGVGAPPEAGEDLLAGLARAETISYGSQGDQALTGYYAEPEGGAQAPAVVLIQEWWGLNPHIEELTRRLAREGFVVLAPDLFHGAVTTEPDEARKLVMALDQEAAVEEVVAAADYLLGQDAVSGDRARVMGFCMGGGLALRAGLASPNFGAVAAFYGSPLTPAEASGMRAATLGLYGSADSGIPVADVRAMDAAFEEAGIQHELVIYDGAGHAFFNDTRESYDPDAAADAWARLLDWFRTKV